MTAGLLSFLFSVNNGAGSVANGANVLPVGTLPNFFVTFSDGLGGFDTSVNGSTAWSGNSVFLSGEQTLQYQVGGNGPIGINAINGAVYGNGGASAALRGMVTEERAHLIERELNRVTSRSIGAGQRMADAMSLTGVNALPALPAANAGLASQLRTVEGLTPTRAATWRPVRPCRSIAPRATEGLT